MRTVFLALALCLAAGTLSAQTRAEQLKKKQEGASSGGAAKGKTAGAAKGGAGATLQGFTGREDCSQKDFIAMVDLVLDKTLEPAPPKGDQTDLQYKVLCERIREEKTKEFTQVVNKAMGSGTFKGWTGTVDEIGSGSGRAMSALGGQDPWVRIKIHERNVSYIYLLRDERRNEQQMVSFFLRSSPIKKAAPFYDTLLTLNKGDAVTFSGHFQLDIRQKLINGRAFVVNARLENETKAYLVLGDRVGVGESFRPTDTNFFFELTELRKR